MICHGDVCSPKFIESISSIVSEFHICSLTSIRGVSPEEVFNQLPAEQLINNLFCTQKNSIGFNLCVMTSGGLLTF